MLSPLVLMANPCSNLSHLTYRDSINSHPGCLIHSKLSINEWMDEWRDGCMEGRQGLGELRAALSICHI